MKTIKTIVNTLKKSNNDINAFNVVNEKTNQVWYYTFEKIQDSILMRVNNSSLTQEWFDNIKHLEFFLNMTDLTNKKYILL
jgi:uncharacterized protein with NRDE domain